MVTISIIAMAPYRATRWRHDIPSTRPDYPAVTPVTPITAYDRRRMYSLLSSHAMPCDHRQPRRHGHGGTQGAVITAGPRTGQGPLPGFGEHRVRDLDPRRARRHTGLGIIVERFRRYALKTLHADARPIPRPARPGQALDHLPVGAGLLYPGLLG
jgi:hypothetical protein